MPVTSSEYEQLFKSNHKSLCNVAYRIVNDRNFAEDIVQDVFLKFWKLRNEINIQTSIKAYLYKSTANASLNFLESNRRVIRYQDEVKYTSSSSDDETSKTISLKELELHIQNALLHLPPKCKAIFVLSRYEGLSYKQIAAQFDISYKTVENQMGKALQIMRQELKPFLTREFLATAISMGICAMNYVFSIAVVILLASVIL